MSKEAMKLALEALESLKVTVSNRTEANVIDGVDLFPKQIAALRKALANEALDKKADNARELGLDYEPARDSGIVTAGGADPRTQRTWVGLTDEAIWLEYQRFWPFHPAEEPTLAKDIAKFAQAIEAKLRSKNEDRN